MNILIIFLLIAASALSALVIKSEKTVRKASGFFAVGVAASVGWLVWPQFVGSAVSVGNWWMVDGLSAIMAGLVALLFLLATLFSIGYIGEEHHDGLISASDVKLYFTLLPLFALTMLVVVLTNHALILWLALEGTTLSSAFLVGFYRKKTSVEAAWKYIIICSTGITLGLIGILLLGYGVPAGVEAGSTTFLLSELLKSAPLISAKVAKWAFIFIFVGFGAKVGFVPTHTWLPDAHSKAPSPISGLFSGILLNVALYAIIRFQAVVNHSLGGHDWTGMFFLVFGSLSVILPAFMLMIQQNYKRMLAYSSIEHMGLVALGLALPPFGTIAAIMHMAGHALTKSALFFGAGEILSRHHTTDTVKIRGLLSYMPYTAILFLLGILAIIAMPPSALFVSEFGLFVVLVKTHLWLALVLLASLGIIAFAMLRSTAGMLFAPTKEMAESKQVKESWNLTHSIIAAELILVVALGAWFSTSAGFSFISSIANNLN